MASLLVAVAAKIRCLWELETLRESNQGIAKRMEAEETLTGLLEGWRFFSDRLRIGSNRISLSRTVAAVHLDVRIIYRGYIALPREPIPADPVGSALYRHPPVDVGHGGCLVEKRARLNVMTRCEQNNMRGHHGSPRSTGMKS